MAEVPKHFAIAHAFLTLGRVDRRDDARNVEVTLDAGVLSPPVFEVECDNWWLIHTLLQVFISEQSSGVIACIFPHIVWVSCRLA